MDPEEQQLLRGRGPLAEGRKRGSQQPGRGRAPQSGRQRSPPWGRADTRTGAGFVCHLQTLGFLLSTRD